MNLMKFLYGLCIFYMMSLLGNSLVFAQPEPEVCSFSNSEIEGIEVGQMSDRQIYTLFTSHLTIEPHRVNTVLRRHRPVEAVAPLDELIQRYQDRIVSEQSDVQKIVELARSGQIDWVGIESDNSSYVENATNAYFNRLSMLNVSLNSVYGWHPGKTVQLLSLEFIPIVIARAIYPNIFRRIRIYPLEDRNLKIESADRRKDVRYWEGLVKQDPLITEDQYTEIINLITNTIAEFRLISDNELEDLLNRLGVPEEPRMTRINIKMFIQSHNDVLSIASRRDVAVVQSVLDIPGNGFIIFGTAHRTGIQQGLIEACRNGNGSP